MTFDANQYKQSTRAQWEDASQAWHRWGPFLETWLETATQRMLDVTGIRAGDDVLDIAAGAGGQSIAAAVRVGSSGRVVATDISPTILTYAAKSAAENQLANIDTLEADGETIKGLAEATFDAVISRLGLIYFPDQRASLQRQRALLREGGRVSAIVYSTADRNPFFSIPVSLIRQRAELPAPAPGQPGPFSLGDPAKLEALFTATGLHDVTVETISAPLRLASATECVRFERESFGALHQMLSGLTVDKQDAVWAEIEHELGRFENEEGFVGPCELLIATGTK